MNQIVLLSFISRLDFISKEISNLSYDHYKINMEKIDMDNGLINGNLFVNDKIISFEIKMVEIDELLIFKSNYWGDDRLDSKLGVDTFAIVKPNNNSFVSPKIKYLVHLIDGKIKQGYIVNRKYKFSNGISENYSKMNMDKKEVLSMINNSFNVGETNKIR